MLPKLREVATTQGVDLSRAYVILRPHEMDEELSRGLCLRQDLRGPILPCGETRASWQGFQELLLGSIQEEHMTVSTATQPAAVADAVMKYAVLVSKRCPEADVHLRKGSDDPSLVAVAVIAPCWDLSLLEDLQALVFSDEVRKDRVLLDVTVYFADVFVPDLSEYARVD